MTTIRGRSIGSGRGSGTAVVTRMPINFAASYITPMNAFFPSRMWDRHHELYRTDLKGKVLVMANCVGSTYSGIVLQGLIRLRIAPAAIVTQDADPFIVSGLVISEVWFHGGLPIVEYRGDDLFERIRTGDRVDVDADSGELTIHPASS